MDEAIIETDIISNKSRQEEELGLCPKCGAIMNVVDKLVEGGFMYIWLECSKSICDGQWLQKKPKTVLLEYEA